MPWVSPKGCVHVHLHINFSHLPQCSETWQWLLHSLGTTKATESRCISRRWVLLPCGHRVPRLRPDIFHNCWTLKALIQLFSTSFLFMSANYPFSLFKISIIFMCPWTFTKGKLGCLQWMDLSVLNSVRLLAYSLLSWLQYLIIPDLASCGMGGEFWIKQLGCIIMWAFRRVPW